MPTCAGNKGNKEGCEAAAITSSGYCYHHAPELREVRQHNARRGGRSGGRGRPSGRREARQVRALVRSLIEQLSSGEISIGVSMNLDKLIDMLRIYVRLLDHDRTTGLCAEGEEQLDTKRIQRDVETNFKARAEREEERKEQLNELVTLAEEHDLPLNMEGLRSLL